MYGSKSLPAAWAVFAFSCSLSGVIWQCPESRAESGINEVTFAAEGYLSNREAFRSFRCEFRFVEATAESADDAIEGKLKNPQEITGVWLVDGENVKYSLLVDSQTVRKTIEEAKKRHQPAASKEGEAVPLPMPRFLGNEVLKYQGHAISHGILAVNVVSLKENAERLEVRRTPWSMNMMGAEECLSPGRLIKECLKFDAERLRYDGSSVVDGVETMVVSLKMKAEPHDLRFDFHFDPKRGFLPIMISQTDLSSGKVRRLAKILEAKHCSKDRWFPTESVLLYDPEEVGKGIRVERFEVLKLNADNPSADDAFFLDLPKEIQVNIRGKHGPYYIHLDAPKRVFGTDLERLYNDTVEAGERRLAQRAAMTGQPYQGAQTGNRIWVIAGCVLAALATLVCVVIVRKRRYAQ